MQREMDHGAGRTLAAASLVLLAAALYSTASNAAACGTQDDFLVAGDPLLAQVRPADCARVYQPTPDFSWPAAKGATAYVVSLVAEDGRVETRTTERNWLSWETPLEPGRYRWTVSAAGKTTRHSAAREFTVDAATGFFAPGRAASH